ncbi:MAG: glycosyltransferase [Bacteroidota bacterium]
MPSQTKPLNKLLYVGMHYDYGRKAQGPSFEYTNFFPVLKKMVPEVVEFDFFTIMQDLGQEAMNAQLLETADRVQPDLIFFILFTEELFINGLTQLSDKFTTFNWFCDDHWRFEYFSKRYAPCFSYISTTDREAIEKYDRIGYKNALMTQWGCNHFDYVKLSNAKKDIDVSFIGQAHGSRKFIIKYLHLNGIDVRTFGQGWENGRVSQPQMIEIFNRSKINLNLSNASWNIHTIFRKKDQIKGRNFEVPACGAFLLTNYVKNLEHYFDLEYEMVCFQSKRDMVRKIRYYLEHETERERIGEKAYLRTLKEHTYEQRFREIFRNMGFEV